MLTESILLKRICMLKCIGQRQNGKKDLATVALTLNLFSLNPLIAFRHQISVVFPN